MKCLIFIFTLCSIGTFIDGQSESDIDTEFTPPEVNQPEDSSEEDENNNPGENSIISEDESGNLEPREVIIMVQGETDTESAPHDVNQPAESSEENENNNTDETDTESAPPDVKQPEESSEENENNNPDESDTESAPPDVNQSEESSEENENNNPDETLNSWKNESGNVKMDSDPEDKKDKEKKKLEVMKLYINEVEAGNMADLIGHNQHIQQSNVYNDLGRRSEPQDLKNHEAETPDYLIPEKAPPELVLLVAKESRLLREGKDNDLDDFDREKLLRSGNYWDGFWKEEVIPKSVLRSAPQEKQLGSIKAIINPGTEFFRVVSRMKKISPKLIYIINKK